MRRLALPALLPLLAVEPASALERSYGSAPLRYGRDGRAYYAPLPYHRRSWSETHSSSVYLRGFTLRRTVSEAETEVGFGRLPSAPPMPPAPPSACGGGGWEVVNAAPGEPTCVGRPRR
jgi:hypothetical protein